MYITGIHNCPHFLKSNFIDYNQLQYFSFNDIFDNNESECDNYPKMKLVDLLFNKTENKKINSKEKEISPNFDFESIFKKSSFDNNNNINEEINNKKENIFFLCLSCGTVLTDKDQLNTHPKEEKHYITINLTDISIWCLECKNPSIKDGKKGTPLTLDESQILLIKNHIQYLREKKYLIPFHKFYSKEEIYNIKYNKFIQNFKDKKFKNIIFMVGAGISTTAGIPDFRSKTGLFQQLQEKYGMESPEEFFYKRTFLEKPEFFYEFCKIFDLSQVKPTITHKFMKYMIDQGIVKYVFTQNIDGLELKAKIPKEKIVFAHGTFTEGHCSRCKIKVDIDKINEGIQNGKVVYCDVCGGPCKPNVVFYGEDLSEDFYKKADESRDCDLVIILGTSLQVYPFAKIPKLLSVKSWKVVFNRDKVGSFLYNFLFSNTLFIQGTTDSTVLQFLKEINLLEDFKGYLLKTFGDDNIDISDNVKMIDIKDIKTNDNDNEVNNEIKIDVEKNENDVSKGNTVKSASREKGGFLWIGYMY